MKYLWESVNLHTVKPSVSWTNNTKQITFLENCANIMNSIDYSFQNVNVAELFMLSGMKAGRKTMYTKLHN